MILCNMYACGSIFAYIVCVSGIFQKLPGGHVRPARRRMIQTQSYGFSIKNRLAVKSCHQAICVVFCSRKALFFVFFAEQVSLGVGFVPPGARFLTSGR